MRISTISASLAAGLVLVVVGFMGCSVNQNPQQLKEKTAETTAALKRDAKAIAGGVREGWGRDKPLDLNHATKPQLESLKGINAAKADQIIANRPYSKPDELVTRGVLSRRDYDTISKLVTVNKQ
jgi:DNA uptake protein ComE-like DNA-binding protein